MKLIKVLILNLNFNFLEPKSRFKKNFFPPLSLLRNIIPNIQTMNMSQAV